MDTDRASRTPLPPAQREWIYGSFALGFGVASIFLVGVGCLSAAWCWRKVQELDRGPETDANSRRKARVGLRFAAFGLVVAAGAGWLVFAGNSFCVHSGYTWEALTWPTWLVLVAAWLSPQVLFVGWAKRASSASRGVLGASVTALISLVVIAYALIVAWLALIFALSASLCS